MFVFPRPGFLNRPVSIKRERIDRTARRLLEEKIRVQISATVAQPHDGQFFCFFTRLQFCTTELGTAELRLNLISAELFMVWIRIYKEVLQGFCNWKTGPLRRGRNVSGVVKVGLIKIIFFFSSLLTVDAINIHFFIIFIREANKGNIARDIRELCSLCSQTLICGEDYLRVFLAESYI